MKFAILTDIHLGPEGYWKGVLRKINKEAELFINNFIETMNKDTNLSFVVVLGDLIEDDSYRNDKKNMQSVIKQMEKLRCPVYYVAGNHDLKNLSESELAKLYKKDQLYYSFDSDKYHFVVLFSRFFWDKKYMEVDDVQSDWLRKDLSATNKKTIIFVHHGLADQDLTGNPWFEGKPEWSLVRNRKQVRSILEKSGKVIAVFNSHLHWDKKHMHKQIPYYTIQSLTENEGDKGIASEAYAVVNIIASRVNVEIKGNYQKIYDENNKI